MSFFCKFWPRPTFAGSSVTRNKCDHFGENLMKIAWIVSETFNVLSVFQMTFFHLKTGDWVVRRSPFMSHTAYRYWVSWSESANIFRISRAVFVKTYYTCFPFHLEKVEKETQVRGKYKLVLSPFLPHWRSIRILRLSIAVSEIRWQNRSKTMKMERMYRETKQNGWLFASRTRHKVYFVCTNIMGMWSSPIPHERSYKYCRIQYSRIS